MRTWRGSVGVDQTDDPADQSIPDAEFVANIAERGAAPVVTVVCITYNHEEFIAEALDSFLAQRTTFRFQVFVGEDHGPDGTADIVRDYAERHPDVIVPFLREENLGAQRNLIDMCQRAGTAYIAFCEGDDFWTDEYKLQKQYELMESNPDLSGCFHNTEIQSDDDWYLTAYYQADKEGRRLIPYSIPRYNNDIRQMRIGYYIRFGAAHTSSMFFRWNYDLEIPDWYYTTVFGDHPIMAMQVGRGLLGFLPAVMSVYRRHSGGIIMSSSERSHHLTTRQDWLVVLEGLADHFREHHGGFAVDDIEARSVTEMRNYLTHAVRSSEREDVFRVIDRHPQAFELMMSDYTETSASRYRLIARMWGSDSAGLRPGVQNQALSVIPSKGMLRRERSAERNRAIDYEQFATVPKQRSSWLFMCDDKASYRGNVRAMYEHVIVEHPEINAVWLTGNPQVRDLLRSEGLPVSSLTAPATRMLLSEASLLFCESLRDDIFGMRGFNAATRVVRLLENKYHRNHEHGLPFSAKETRDEHHQPVEGSPRDWRSQSNLVVTDSGVLVASLLASGGGQSPQVIRIDAEPRLLGIPEPLTPYGTRHLLLNPGDLSYDETEAFALWIIDGAEQLDALGNEAGITFHVVLPTNPRFKLPIADRIAAADHVQPLESLDVAGHLTAFAGAVSGPDPLIFSLVRRGVPVMPCSPRGRGAMPDEELFPGESILGPAARGWAEAVASVVSRLDTASTANIDLDALGAEFDIIVEPAQNGLEVLFEAVSRWSEGGVTR